MVLSSPHSRRRFHLGDLTRSLLRPGCGLPAPRPAPVAFDDEEDRCIKQCIETLRKYPGDAAAYYRRGLAYLNKGFYAVALSDLRHAVRCEPGFAAAYYESALIQLGTAEPRVRDLPAAVENAGHACRLTGYLNWPYVRTLVTAHAELGRHAEVLRLLLAAEALVPAEDAAWWSALVRDASERLFADFMEGEVPEVDPAGIGPAATAVLRPERIPREQLASIPAALARRLRVVPLGAAGGVARFAAARADDFDLIALLQFASGGAVEVIAVPGRLLDAALERCYGEPTNP